jgi:hypothetical protein
VVANLGSKSSLIGFLLSLTSQKEVTQEDLKAIYIKTLACFPSPIGYELQGSGLAWLVTDGAENTPKLAPVDLLQLATRTQSEMGKSIG